MNERSWHLLAIGLLLAFYAFSVMGLVVVNELVYPWFKTGYTVSDDYLGPSNVVRNGLGNLYIVFLFVAGRTLRNWYYANLEQKGLLQVELRQQMEDARSRVQPMMLLYAIDRIDIMVEEGSADVTRAIALTSELLSEVMMYQEERKQWFSREIELVRKLIDLMNLLMEREMDVEFFVAGDPEKVQLPPMILFSLVDLVFRRFGKQEILPEMHLEVSGYSSMLTLQLLHDRKDQKDNLDECMRTLSRIEDLYGERIFIKYSKHPYGCSLVVGNKAQRGVKGVHALQTAVNPSPGVPG